METWGALGRGFTDVITRIAKIGGANPLCTYTAMEIQHGLTSAVTAALYNGIEWQVNQAV